MKVFKFCCLMAFMSFVVPAFAQWNTSGTDIYNTNSGDVGIGISSPESKLHVKNGDIQITKGKRILFGDAGVGSGEQILNNNFDLTFRTGWSNRMVIANTGRVGIGYTSPSYKLDVNGTVRASSYLTSSDKRFKTNIKNVTNALDKLSRVQGVSYSFNKEKFSGRSFPEHEKYGVIAQDIQKVFPDMVYEDAEGYLSVDYVEFVPILIEAIKELRIELLSLKTTEAELKLKNGGDEGKNIIIEQNAPNPFNSTASIRFEISEEIEDAKMFIYDMSGSQIMSSEIKQRGKGSFEIQSGSLEPGIYLYTIIGDGNQGEVRRMIITK